MPYATSESTMMSATMYHCGDRTFCEENCQVNIVKSYVAEERSSTNFVIRNHAESASANPRSDHFMPAFALSTQVLSPVIPLASCICTA